MNTENLIAAKFDYYSLTKHIIMHIKRKTGYLLSGVSLYYLIVVYLIVKYTPLEILLSIYHLITVKNLNSDGINFPNEREFVAATNFSSM